MRRAAHIAPVAAAAAVLGVLSVGCGGDQKTGSSMSYGDDARREYQAALEEFRDGNCQEAEPAFRRIKREYPYSRFSALAELRIADCLLKQNKQAEAIQAYRQFVRFRPSHSQVPYARFKIAKAHFEQIPDDWLLSPASHERDQGPTREALRQLRRFMLDFPDDERVPEAREMMTKALELLALHELSVAEFYQDRDAHKAVVGRLRTLLDSYQGSGVEPRALLMLGRTYLNMRDRPKARQTFQDLVERYPESDQADDAREHLGELGGGSQGAKAQR